MITRIINNAPELSYYISPTGPRTVILQQFVTGLSSTLAHSMNTLNTWQKSSESPSAQQKPQLCSGDIPADTLYIKEESRGQAAPQF